MNFHFTELFDSLFLRSLILTKHYVCAVWPHLCVDSSVLLRIFSDVPSISRVSLVTLWTVVTTSAPGILVLGETGVDLVPGLPPPGQGLPCMMAIGGGGDPLQGPGLGPGPGDAPGPGGLVRARPR